MNRLPVVCAFLSVFFVVGCVAPTSGGGGVGDSWGPGVRDVDRVRHMLTDLLSEDSGDSGVYRAQGMMSVLTWEQATYLCRTAPEEIKFDVVMYVLDKGGGSLVGLTRREVIDLLGHPVSDSEREIIYGNACDSGSGFVIDFDDNDRVVFLSKAN